MQASIASNLLLQQSPLRKTLCKVEKSLISPCRKLGLCIERRITNHIYTWINSAHPRRAGIVFTPNISEFRIAHLLTWKPGSIHAVHVPACSTRPNPIRCSLLKHVLALILTLSGDQAAALDFKSPNGTNTTCACCKGADME